MVTNNSCDYAPTQFNVQSGGANGTLNNIAPSSTSGVPVISQGASSNPIFGTAVVAGGGTGDTSFTANSVICAGTTTTGAFQNAAPGATSGVPLISQGTSTVPVFGTAVVAGGGTGSTSFTTYGPVVAASTTTGALTSVSPSATSGVPFISQGSAANPAFGTAVVAGGGTGNTTFTAYSVVCAGTTATGAFQNVSGVGTSGQVLTSNGAAALPTWQDGTSSLQIVNQVFTSTGTYTPTTNMKYCTVICVGGGGAGGGAATTGATTANAGSGGGEGETAYGVFSAATIGASKAVTIGAGGTGVNGAAGNAGGTTSLGTLMTAVGGSAGGTIASGSAGSFSGGAGGTGGTVASYNTPGNRGGTSFWSIAGGTGYAGPGSTGRFGEGGDGGAVNANGNAASGYGAGGSGAFNFSSQGTARTGGSGAPGLVVVTEYVIA